MGDRARFIGLICLYCAAMGLAGVLGFLGLWAFFLMWLSVACILLLTGILWAFCRRIEQKFDHLEEVIRQGPEGASCPGASELSTTTRGGSKQPAASAGTGLEPKE